MTILVGYRPKPAARRALAEAATMARERNRPLHILRYLEHEAGESPKQVRHEAGESSAVQAELAQLREEFERDGIEVIVQVVHGLRGGAGRALLDVARSIDAELIVLGASKRSTFEEIVLGSVVREVLAGAGCPVLTVKADEDGS